MSVTLENALIATFIGVLLVGGGGFITNFAKDQICAKVPDSTQYDYCKKEEPKK